MVIRLYISNLKRGGFVKLKLVVLFAPVIIVFCSCSFNDDDCYINTILQYPEQSMNSSNFCTRIIKPKDDDSNVMGEVGSFLNSGKYNVVSIKLKRSNTTAIYYEAVIVYDMSWRGPGNDIRLYTYSSQSNLYIHGEKDHSRDKLDNIQYSGKFEVLGFEVDLGPNNCNTDYVFYREKTTK